MVCIFLKNPNYITEQAFLIFAERSCLNFLTCKKLVNWGNGHNSRYFFYISIVHCNKLSRFWFSQLSHKYKVRFATNIRSQITDCALTAGGDDSLNKLVCNDTAAGKNGRWRRNLATNLWQNEWKPIFSGSHSEWSFIVTWDEWSKWSFIVTWDEPSSVLQLSNLFTSKILCMRRKTCRDEIPCVLPQNHGTL